MAVILSVLASGFASDTVVNLDEVTVSANVKLTDKLERLAVASSTFGVKQIDDGGICSVKDVSVAVPNFYQPKYGSRITSSIYIRGFGSRIDQPAMGLIIDNVPILNKNAYDFDFIDIRRIDVLRGPQGTLYGRNSNGGIISIGTLSPLAWQGTKVGCGGDSETSAKVRFAHFGRTQSKRLGYAVSAQYQHNNGYFTNTYNGEKCDAGNSVSARAKIHWIPQTSRWDIENSLSFNLVDEGGYAYRQFDEKQNILLPISYNDSCHYERLNLVDGLVARYSGDEVDIVSVSSYQFLNDRMQLDNDFTAESYFTLTQKQQEHAVTQEVLFRQHDKTKRWQWSTGAFVFGKQLKMDAPVTFKRDGIENLILKNANKGISIVFPDNQIEIADSAFPIDCHFTIPTVGAAVFHESNWNTGQWRFTAGLRLDFEHARMDYNENCDIRYRFDLVMNNFRTLHSDFKGRETTTSFVALPKLSAQYSFGNSSVYATFANGHKAGGFNTQIFSDIMQSVLMNQMIRDIGMTPKSDREESAHDTKYAPETNYNFEIGFRHRAADFSTSTTLFWIEGVNQQITVMPEGSGIGRMMSNAGRSRSIGFEHSSRYEPGNWQFALDAGLTDARFRDYQYNDTTNYRNRHIPYAPTWTLSASAKHTWELNAKLADRISLSAQSQTIGKIYWNEDNSLWQSAYTLFSANLALQKNNFSVGLFARNITNRDYQTFYFKSISRMFYSGGTPRVFGINISLSIQSNNS